MTQRFRLIEDRLRRIPVGRRSIEQLLRKMHEDLAAAEANLPRFPNWAVQAAYQAIYDGCTALMAAHGYRAKVNGHHWVAIRFAIIALPEHEDLFDEADELRQRRHRTVYEVAEVTETDARWAVGLAQRASGVLSKATADALRSTPKEKP